MKEKQLISKIETYTDQKLQLLQPGILIESWINQLTLWCQKIGLRNKIKLKWPYQNA